MTAACGGGTSAPKTGAAAVVDYSAGLLGAIFAAYDLAWLIPIIPLVGLAPLTLTTFCASDPPATPTFTTAEINALLQLEFGTDFDNGLSKFRDWCLRAIWYDACQCTSGALVTNVPPTQPSGGITVVYPTGAAATPCINFSDTRGMTPAGGVVRVDIPGQALNYTHAYLTLQDLDATSTSNINCELHAYNSADTDLGAIMFLNTGVGSTVLRSTDGPVFTGTDHFRIAYTPQGISSHTYNPTATVKVYCDGQLATSTQQPCCPPDSATQATLNTILDLVKSMQRQIAPFGYAAGTAHAGLTGTGSIAVSRLLGVSVHVTSTLPPAIEMAGNPPYFPDLGWLSLSEVDGMILERRVSQQLFSWFPKDAQLADHVNYAFTGGVTATITELVPEA